MEGLAKLQVITELESELPLARVTAHSWVQMLHAGIGQCWWVMLLDALGNHLNSQFIVQIK